MKKTRFIAAALAALLCGCGGGGDSDSGSGSGMDSPSALRLSSITITSGVSGENNHLGMFAGTVTAEFGAAASSASSTQASTSVFSAPGSGISNLTYWRSSGSRCVLEADVSPYPAHVVGTTVCSVAHCTLYVAFSSRSGNTITGEVYNAAVTASVCGKVTCNPLSRGMIVTIELDDAADSSGGDAAE